MEGLLTGIQMNFRAAVIITGFAVLGTELYNPVIRDFFQKTALKNLPLALELSVESLPMFIGSIPDLKSLVRKPVSIFYSVLSLGRPDLLTELKYGNNAERKIFIVCGPVGGGKTTYTRNITEFLKDQDINSEGILSERIMAGSKTTGYDIVDIATGNGKNFSGRMEIREKKQSGNFIFIPQVLKQADHSRSPVSEKTGIVIIDEVGFMELQGRGWYNSISELLDKSPNHILMTVRDKYVDEVKKNGNLTEAIIFNVPDNDNRKAGDLSKDKKLKSDYLTTKSTKDTSKSTKLYSIN
ncbi:MAG: hypothetical protein MZV64_28700 [Ignavibacteriales bacterium]|nr:hypothetical protein [Ignavibacteriales bacterium]